MSFTNKNLEIGIASKEATEEALKNISKFFSSAKVIRSTDHPDLAVRGSRELKAFPPDVDSHYRADRLDNVHDDDI